MEHVTKQYIVEGDMLNAMPHKIASDLAVGVHGFDIVDSMKAGNPNLSKEGILEMFVKAAGITATEELGGYKRLKNGCTETNLSLLPIPKDKEILKRYWSGINGCHFDLDYNEAMDLFKTGIAYYRKLAKLRSKLDKQE